ncbi:Ribosomal-protein-S18p-alanine acetyltransferase [Rhodovulum sp. P5]|uniref:GNAT family N-acetyltransferase n=1 Tax=Rhodovulum sp. P5 TaxID=1564506 RepID=UPI0009C3519B|nr:GNAT family N-acetyltransferase [Rhodovulum sp. P5]ARE38736.1 Ribosomal-protein-S18p-alanine acetyltransferase [Rhodovulum sp. P5]
MTPEALAVLHSLCFTYPRPWTAAEFTAVLESPGVFLCESDAGVALGRALAGEAELLTLAVHPTQRRAGCGRALLAQFEAEARMREAEDAFLEVAEDNRPARALYTGAGYRDAGRRPRYYAKREGTRVDALILRKQLAP